ncbi:leucine-rich repeat-domain-containing protein [Fimicolochytrium jonesii]|uniref:leucine-rich repeat-domain-containing protein n=1 Tax=Fimicolochytrium jonesii TaxID=1396493 RepID=UPI0022FDEDA1|nr:leucine-rich repeat-domain-containing protein [Fimicolochytrium jonesii]KAI8824085.1 leucine-rich repeat-domain-containing protein [Fimicolochytrium jonesii]
MVKLNYDVLSVASSFINAVQDRELNLRGLKIPQIENLAITKDGNDVIDFTDNELRRLDGFPLMKRLKAILASNNRIARVDLELAKQLPNLKTLIMANNLIEELGDLDPLANLEHLECLSLMDNPVATKKYYRQYIIHRCPKVRILDFRKVKEKERQEAASLFSGADGTKLAASLSATSSRTFEPGEGLKKTPKLYQGPSPEEAAKIREAIKNAKTLDEVTRLEKLLQTGQVPDGTAQATKQDDMMEAEEEA